MAEIIGWYYLHENGSLIYKREMGSTAADIRESTFARALWPLVQSDREGAWTILVEALCFGADKVRIVELATKWHCDDEDAAVYAERIGVQLSRDGSAWMATRRDFVDLQVSPAGFGDTALEALAALCKELGLKPGKMWQAHFADLLAPAAPAATPET